jgi:YggT family protein
MLFFLFVTLFSSAVSASVYLPYDRVSQFGLTSSQNSNILRSRRAFVNRNRNVACGSSKAAAMAIPGYGVAEQVFVGGFSNFLSIYNLIITARVLLSWVPQAQSIGALQPIYQITDPYLNLFRGIIPSIGGLDLSPLAAFFLLNVLTNATAAVGCELTPAMKKKLESTKRFMVEGRFQDK